MKWNRLVSFIYTRIRAIGVDDEPEPDEWELLQRPVGTLDNQAVVNAVWRIEGLIVLAWSLSWLELPPYDQLVDPSNTHKALVLVDAEQAKEMIAQATLRTQDDIAALNKHLLAFHWRVRNHRLRPTPMDLVAFSQNCWFGSFDIGKFRVIDGDLAIGANPIGKASPEERSVCGSIAQERHLAINWLRGYSQIYVDERRSPTRATTQGLQCNSTGTSGQQFSLRIEAYEFPDEELGPTEDNPADEFDTGRFLIVSVAFSDAGRQWHASRPIMETSELQRLIDWLESLSIARS